MQLKTYNKIIVLGFVIFLSLPALFALCGLELGDAKKENRKLADKPELSLATLEEYPSNFDAYYNDRFALRSLYNLWYAYLSYALVKPEKPDKLIKAENDFYFDSKQAAKLYMGYDMLKEDQLIELETELARRKAYCEERDCKYYLVTVPSKYHVFKEQIPWSFKLHEAKYNRLDQIAESAEKANINFLDLRRVFEKVNAEGFYHRLDNHWNQTGGMHAGIAINEMLRKDFPQIAPISIKDYKKRKTLRKGGNLANGINASSFLNETEYKYSPIDTNLQVENGVKRDYPVTDFAYSWGYEIVKKTKHTNYPKALIIRDSFGDYIIPFVAANFSESVFIWDKWQYKMNEDIFEKEKPEVFIQIVFELDADRLKNR